jgi:predicted nucleic acid-binding protein
MIFVDTSVWIDFFKGAELAEVTKLEQLLNSEESISYSGIILQELFQGVNTSRQRKLIEECFTHFLELFPQRSTYLFAAKIFRESRSNGHPIRSSVDCLIASLAIENDCRLLHKDRDFKYIEDISPLKTIQV